MQKWRRIYHSQQPTKMPRLKDEEGITLVELLAALAILGVVMMLAGSIHMFGQHQFINQSESAEQTNDLNHALTIMSTELRSQKPTDVSVEDKIITIKGGSVYKRINNQLYQNGTPIVDSVTEFEPEKENPETEQIKIAITVSNDKPGVGTKEQETTIYFRGEADETAEDDAK